MSTNNIKNHIISSESPVSTIFAQEEFLQLDKKEQEYTYHLFKASWEGTKICYFQRSWESPALFYILQQIFLSEDLKSLKNSCIKNQITEEQFTKILVYCCAFFQNCGNYLSFGDTKFIPEIPEEIFYKFISSSKCFENEQIKAKINSLWERIRKFVYNFNGIYGSLGVKPEGLSGFYAHEMSKEEIILIDEFLQILKISPLNTRIGKISDKEFSIHIASVNLRKKNTHFFKDIKIHLIFGDFSPFIRRMGKSLEKAYEFSANRTQKKMYDFYLEHFQTGEIEAHKESQKFWVKDISPIIETNIGFVETYMDPLGVRAEFESWVAVVNKEQSLKTSNLVSHADELLDKNSPWPKEFEKDKFLKPDFTSLSVVAFGCSGTPLGINIPNYDDIVQDFGFKNVYLANNTVNYKKIDFIEESLGDNLLKHNKNNMFFIVAYHELLGHGCGKLFSENSSGEKNFDENLINPITKKKIETWYKKEDTWSSVFGKLSNPYEECRADSVALYYSCFEEAFDVLLPECKSFWEEICLACFTEFVIQGLKALQFYNTETKSFGQAHMNAGYVILKVLIEAGNNFIEIKKTKNKGKNGEEIDWIIVNIDKSQILTTGKKAMGDFLLKMNVFKATADFQRGKEMFEKYSEVDEFFLELRKIIIDNKKPRRIEIQGNLIKENNGEINFRKYEDDFSGIIESFKDRYPYVDEEILNEWENMQDYFKPYSLDI